MQPGVRRAGTDGGLALVLLRVDVERGVVQVARDEARGNAEPALSGFGGRVADSGEGRWTIKAAIDEAVPAPVLTAALYERFSSRGAAGFQKKLMSAMRLGFGGHHEQPEKS